jgi:alkanesulfonate monooxygenase SsuD/methylene tetrahydromethanopterin reductase-like flavin-dependent oxidoreductase (luciferase family)
MGLSVGGFPHEFAAAGLPTTLAARAHLASTNADLCRRLWRGERTPSPLWGGGSTPAACRRVVEYCDGWMPARITLETFKTRLDYIRDLSESAGRHRVTAAVMPLTSIANDRATALGHVHVQALLAEAKRNATWVKPAGGSFSTLEDIKGLILAGTASDIVRETRAFQSAGAELIVFDLRFRYRDWFQQIELLGELVLPEIRAGGNSAYQRDQR